MIDQKQLQKELKIIAEGDVRTAIAEGRLTVTGTHAGNVEIVHCAGVFTFNGFNTGETIKGGLNLKQAVAFLSTLYKVEGV